MGCHPHLHLSSVEGITFPLFYIPRVVCFPGLTLTDIVFIQNLFYMYMNCLWYKILVRSRMGVFQFYKCSVGSYYVQSGYIGNNLLIVTQSGSKNLRSAKSFFSGQWNIIDSINFLPAYKKKILGDGNIYECSCLNCVKVRVFLWWCHQIAYWCVFSENVSKFIQTVMYTDYLAGKVRIIFRKEGGTHVSSHPQYKYMRIEPNGPLRTSRSSVIDLWSLWGPPTR